MSAGPSFQNISLENQAIPVSRTKENIFLAGILCLYILLGLLGIHQGLPHEGRPLPYNIDEVTWLETLSKLDPSKGHWNPHPEFHHPTFYLWTYAAALTAARVAGYLPRHATKEMLREHLELVSRFYLVGRYLQILFGVGLLLTLWWAGRTFFNPWIGLVAASFMALCPGMVAAAHYSQASVLVAFLSFLSVAFLLKDQECGDQSLLYISLAAFSAGLAISTKYSGLVLIPCLLWEATRSGGILKRALAALACLTIGFVLGSPFSLLAPQTFMQGFRHHLHDNAVIDNIPGFWKSAVYPLQNALPNLFGWPLFIGMIAAFLWSLSFTEPRRRLLTLFFLLFYIASAKVGWIATSMRMLVIAPCASLLLASALNDLLVRGFKPWLVQGIAGVLLLSCIPYSMAIITLRREEPFQQVTSRWIQSNVSTDRSIGVPRKEPYWWSPDIVYASFFHPERLSHPYTVWGLDFSKAALIQKQPDILVVSQTEWARCESIHSASDCADFFDAITNGTQYHLIKSFPRSIGWGPWIWKRPEIKFQSDDDLWATAISIYERGKE